MDMAQRQLAASQAAQAFRNAWRLMDDLIGYDASSDVAEIHTLANIRTNKENQLGKLF